jgi:hypothetical protein
MADDQEWNGIGGASPKVEAQKTRAPHSGGGLYEIHVKGHLNSSWSDWLEGMEVKLLDNGEMILSGPILDQSALMGVLIKLSRLNLAIISVNQIQARKVVGALLDVTKLYPNGTLAAPSTQKGFQPNKELKNHE